MGDLAQGGDKQAKAMQLTTTAMGSFQRTFRMWKTPESSSGP
jgi:hypothetical protein